MDNEKLPQTTTNQTQKFVCEKCDYSTCDRSNWAKHCKTVRHRKAQWITGDNEVVPQTTTKYSCVCGRSYNYMSGLCKHKRKCTYGPQSQSTSSDIDKDQLIMMLLKKTQEQNEQLQNQLHVMTDLVKRVGNNNSADINNSFNSTNIILQLNSSYPNAQPVKYLIDQIKENTRCITHDPNMYAQALIEALSKQSEDERTVRAVKDTLYVKEDTSFTEDKDVEVFDTIKQETELDQIGKAATQNPNMFLREKEGKEYPELVSGIMKKLTPGEKKKMKKQVIKAIGNDEVA